MSMAPGPTPSPFSCPSCGLESPGPYCTGCGEKQLGADDRSLRHYFDVVADFLTHFDSKGYRSLWYLVARPGFLSEEQLRGARVRYAKPLSLFISLNVVYYISIAWFGAHTFTTPLAVQLHQNDYYPAYAARQVEARIQADNTPLAAFEAKYNARTGVLSKTLVFLFIPIYAVIFQALFFRRRRFVMEHAVIATHFWSFMLLLLAVAVPAIAAALMWGSGERSIAATLEAYDGPVSVFLQLCVAAYLALMFRRAYGVRFWYCATVAVVIAWSFFHIVWLYRFLLFVITLHFL
jgi:hypothetical protein